MKPLDLIAFDADDTLWHNEPLYTMTQEKFIALLALDRTSEWIMQQLYRVEVRNLEQWIRDHTRGS